MRKCQRSEGWYSPRVHFCQMFKDNQSDMVKVDVSISFSASVPLAHHLLHHHHRCSFLQRLMFTAALITAGLKT